jgi:predicted dehydrogenase
MHSPPRAILVGCGLMSSEWLRCANELNIALVGLVDLNSIAAEARAKEFNLPSPIFKDFREAIARTDADVLFDCTVPAIHKEVSSAALQAGLHVLEEKPLALTMEDARELVQLSETTGRLHVVQQNRRFNRGVRLLRQMIVEGVIGEVTTVHVDFFLGPHFGGFREQIQHVLLTDMAIHPFDAARYIIDANATSVYCEEWNPPNSWYQHGASVAAVFRMSNGVRFSYRASWCADGFRTSWDGSWRIIGTKGTLVWDGEQDVRAERIKTSGGFFSETEVILPTREPAPELTRGHYSVMRQFLGALSGGPMPETRSSDNIHSLAMVDAAIRSADKGQRVPVSAADASGEGRVASG